MIATYCDIPVFKSFPDKKPKPTVDRDLIRHVFPDKDFRFKFFVDLKHLYIGVDPVTGEMILTGENPVDVDYSKAKTEKKRADNVKRACDKIYDLVMLNDWNYFFTGTLGNTAFDATDAKSALSPLQNWLKNATKRFGLKYVLVAEYQPKSGKIHFHGFINDALRVEDSGTRLVKGYSKPIKIETAVKKGISLDNAQIVYNIPQWKFGYTTAIETYNGSQGCANYIRKYITKENKAIFGRYYWSSRNLCREPTLYYEDVDYDSIIAREYSIPRVRQKFKYYTFFPGQDDFHYKQASDNSADILAMLEGFEEITSEWEFEEV